MSLARTFPERRRRRLTARFRPIVDGLFDKARARAETAKQEEREPMLGQWQRSHPYSYELELIESTSGNPMTTLGRAIDGVHCGDLIAVAVVAISPDGVIHTGWSDGDMETLSRAAGFLSDDLAKL